MKKALDVGSIPTASTNFTMNKSHFSYFVIFFLLIILSILANTAHATDRKERYSTDPDVIERPPRRATWLVSPTVIVCEGSMVTEREVKRAMGWWITHGFYFKSFLFHEDPEGKCTDDTPDDHIVIRAVTSEIREEMKTGTLAETHFYTNPDNLAIEFAVIYLVFEPVERVLEHELGHALGYYHYNKPGHLMHNRNGLSGWDDHGLKRTDPMVTERRQSEAKQQKSHEK